MDDESTVRREPQIHPVTLGGCVIERVLGEGGMGIVYLARQVKMGRPVALKVMRSFDTTARARFLREAKVASQLAHPNIVQVHDIGEEDRQLYIVMEYVEGTTLYQKIESGGPLPEPLAASIVVQVARALQYAHEKGIVHRDVKPANVLLTRQDLAKLADLGLARWKERPEEASLTKTGTIFGSFPYMSPEQFDDPRQVDARSDIYSLGATFYHALTGQSPFSGAGVTQLASRHATAPRPDPRAIAPRVSPRAVEVYRKMMAIKPGDRYRSMEEVCRALDPSALSAPLPGKVTARIRGFRWGRVAAGAALTATLLAAGVIFRGPWRSREDATPAPETGDREGRAEPASPADPRPPGLAAGRFEILPDGRLRFFYDFDDPAELADWEGVSGQAVLRDGALFVSGGSPAVARFNLHLAAERVKVVASCVQADWSAHVNVYLNTQWRGNWQGSGGATCIFRGDGIMVCVDGREILDGRPPTCETGRTYTEEIELRGGTEIHWTIDGETVYSESFPELTTSRGHVLVGAFEATARFDSIEIVGHLGGGEDPK